jgi:dihydroorotate dehydrogenase/NAD-dependent dihydropyrimidine dehydrogenase PreA subunit
MPGRGVNNGGKIAMSLSIEFLGFRLKNPLMLTEGPFSGNKHLLEKASEAEIGLIFTKGIRPEAANSPVPYIRKYEQSLINADWSCIGLAKWLEVLESLDIHTPLVTSIAKNYVTPQTAVEMAKKLVAAGSQIVSFVDYNPVELIETVRLARPVIKVPLMVKLPPFLPELEDILKALVSAGVDAIAAMDSIGPVLSIDTETGAPFMGSPDGSGYLSGKYILPVTLKYIYEISQCVNVPVVGVGGVTDTSSALQMIMAGATGVGMVTAPMLKGLHVFKKVAEGISSYMDKKNIVSLGTIRGITHKRVKEQIVSSSLKGNIDQDLCTSCDACRRICYAEAIDVSLEKYRIKREKCIGCGLCASVCPVEAISFR